MALQVWYAGSDPTYAYYATGTRVYQLAAGVLLAMVTRLVVFPARVGWPLAILGLVGVVVVGSALVDVTPSTRGLLATAASVAVIAGLYAAPSGLAARLLALPVPRFLGQISYGTYLWHWPVILVVGQLFDVGALVLVALAAPIATGLAALSYEIFERPIRKAPALDRFRWPVVGAGLGVSLIAAVFVIPPLLQATVRPVVGNPEPADLSALAEQAAWLEEPVPPGLDLVAALDDVPEAGEPCTTDDLEVCVRVTGSGERVLLVGDSQAAMFVTALESLAREQDFTLLTNVVRGCGWQAGSGTPVRGRAHHVLPRRAPPPRRRHGGGRQPLPRGARLAGEARRTPAALRARRCRSCTSGRRRRPPTSSTRRVLGW